MTEIFTSTHWRDTTRNMLINNERILYVERTEGECVVYTITFDNGETLTLDEPTGKMFTLQLARLRRPVSPPLPQPPSGERYRFPRRRRHILGRENCNRLVGSDIDLY